MKKRNNIFILILLLVSAPAFSQQLTGKVVEKDDKGKESPLPMAGIKWQGTIIIATSDHKGDFEIPFPDSLPAKLVVSMVGYRNDTVLFNDKTKTNSKIVLRSAATTLNTVNITGK